MASTTHVFGDFATLAGVFVGLLTFVVGATLLVTAGVDDQVAGVLAGVAGAAGLWSVGLVSALG